MSKAVPQLNEADDELLTGYLDQELSPDERSAFEKRLVHDEPLRRRLAEMRRAWDLLDELPETPFTPNFTQSTLEMVAIDLEKEKARAQPILGWRFPNWFPQWSLRTRAAMLFCSAVLVGGVIGLVVRTRSRTMEAYDLALAARLPTLQDFPKLEMLRPLTSLPGWKSLLDNGAIRDRVLTSLPDGHDRRSVEEYVNRLDAHQKEILWGRKLAFEKLNIPERLELNQRYEQVQRLVKSDADLQQMAILLSGVLQTMTMSERAELRSLPEDRKLARLEEELCFELGKQRFNKLTPDERAHLQEWKFKQLIPQLRSNIPFPITPIEPGNQDGLIAGSLYFAMRNGNNSFEGQEALIESLCAGLSEQTVRLIAGMSKRHQMSTIANWATERRFEPNRSISADDLYKQYQELDPKRREEIDLKRPEDTRNFLEGRDMRARRGPGDRIGPRPGGGMLGPGGPGPGGPIPQEGKRGDRQPSPMDRPGFGPPGNGGGPQNFPPPNSNGGQPPRPDRNFGPPSESR